MASRLSSRPPAASPRRQDGVFSILFAVLLLVLIGFCGLAIDSGQMYNRKVDLNALAEAVALSAARELNGTAAGITAAKTSARTTAERLTYRNGQAITWDDGALSFGAAPARSGTWVSASGVVPNPERLFYAKVDTSQLAAELAQIRPLFMPVLSSSLATITLADSAVAGRSSVNVTPIAVCAMAPDAASERTNPGLGTNELIQYGFRRGVGYDLMQLNPNGNAPLRYLVNPVLAPDVNSAVFDTTLVGPFVCTGSMWVPRVTGGFMRVTKLPDSAPLADLWRQLNSRFDDYANNACSPNGAPPDYNVKAYNYSVANGAPWMTPASGAAGNALAAASTTTRGKLETIADLADPPPGSVATDYGPLWAYAKAAKYAATEPGSGYASFATGDWPKLYRSGPTTTTYPAASATPYAASSGNNFAAPSAAHAEIASDQRRVLNIPLLACPVAAGANAQATVLAVGRFFMTVPATSERLIGEFAGLASPQQLGGQVELYP